jgi:hypothetical protein
MSSSLQKKNKRLYQNFLFNIHYYININLNQLIDPDGDASINI